MSMESILHFIEDENILTGDEQLRATLQMSAVVDDEAESDGTRSRSNVQNSK